MYSSTDYRRRPDSLRCHNLVSKWSAGPVPKQCKTGVLSHDVHRLLIVVCFLGWDEMGCDDVHPRAGMQWTLGPRTRHRPCRRSPLSCFSTMRCLVSGCSSLRLVLSRLVFSLLSLVRGGWGSADLSQHSPINLSTISTPNPPVHGPLVLPFCLKSGDVI